MDDASNTSAATRLRFNLNHLLAATTALSVPIALFARYWINVNRTVDERTIPFSRAGTIQQVYLVSGFAVVGILAAFFFLVMVKRKQRLGATVFVCALLICAVPASWFVNSKIVDPVHGNEVARIHNEAAAIVASAVDRFYGRTQQWPRNWNDLENDIADVISDVRKRTIIVAKDPFTSAGDPFSDDLIEREESQSVYSRGPELGNLDAIKIREFVDIDFAADPKRLATMNWVEFDGIVPHKPTYNLYRVEFGKLIDRLKRPPGSADVSL